MKLGTLVRISSLEQVDKSLAELKACGYTACHFGHRFVDFDRAMAEGIRNLADKHGIDIAAHYIGYRDPYQAYDLRDGFLVAGIVPPAHREMRMNYLMQGLEFVSWAGIRNMVMWAGFIPNNPFDHDCPALLATLRALCDRAEALGIHIILETGAESPIAMLRTLEETGAPNLSVCLDTGNAISYGYGNPVEALYTYGQYVRHIHLSDAVPPTHCYERGAQVPLGQGLVEFDRFFKKLRAIGFDDAIICECDKDDLVRAKAFVSPYLIKYGWLDA